MAERKAAIAVLASGASKRFGGRKLQFALHGKPLAAHILDRALTQCRQIAIIVREEDADDWNGSYETCEIIQNPNAQNGIGASIRCAANWAVANDANGLILLLADMPFIPSNLIARWANTAEIGLVAACRYPDGKLGIPAAFPQSAFCQLQQFSDDEGAKRLLQDAVALTFKPPPEALFDIDTRADLAKAEQILAQGMLAASKMRQSIVG